MAGAIGFENIASGIGGVCVVAYFSALCDLRFTAAQYALISAAASIVGRFLTGTTAGALIEAMGYVNFYLLTTAIAVPGIILFWFMMRTGLVDAVDRQRRGRRERRRPRRSDPEPGKPISPAADRSPPALRRRGRANRRSGRARLRDGRERLFDAVVGSAAKPSWPAHVGKFVRREAGVVGDRRRVCTRATMPANGSSIAGGILGCEAREDEVQRLPSANWCSTQSRDLPRGRGIVAAVEPDFAIARRAARARGAAAAPASRPSPWPRASAEAGRRSTVWWRSMATASAAFIAWWRAGQAGAGAGRARPDASR